MGRACSEHDGDEKWHPKFWSENPRRLLVRHRHSREDNIKMDLKEIGWDSVDWIHVAQN
jgi:hypothetical protein